MSPSKRIDPWSYCLNLKSSYICMHGWVVSHMNESRHICMSHVTYEWLMSHANESWITTLHLDASVSLFDASRDFLIYQMTRSHVSRVNMPCDTRIDMCDMTHLSRMRPTATATAARRVEKERTFGKERMLEKERRVEKERTLEKERTVEKNRTVVL